MKKFTVVEELNKEVLVNVHIDAVDSNTLIDLVRRNPSAITDSIETLRENPIFLEMPDIAHEVGDFLEGSWDIPESELTEDELIGNYLKEVNPGSFDRLRGLSKETIREVLKEVQNKRKNSLHKESKKSNVVLEYEEKKRDIDI